jgi:hypothetical protein
MKGNEMAATNGKNFADKHGSNDRVDDSIKEAILKSLKDGQLPCAVAFEIAENLKTTPTEVGKTADLLNLRLNKCQLGLFGYKPKKKIVKPLSDVDPELKDAIISSLVGEKLPCKDAWKIASRFGVPKMNVSAACEAIDRKISACQLGAF